LLRGCCTWKRNDVDAVQTGSAGIEFANAGKSRSAASEMVMLANNDPRVGGSAGDRNTACTCSGAPTRF
jgi:hypothetical protein